jgi:uncharacterized YigZ family protein
MEDLYRTIRSRTITEIKVKGSRFIAEAIPVLSEEEAAGEIEAIKKREYSATHHCTAYRLGPDGSLFRYNDDGEPNGTAGLPILRQIDARSLTNTLVVVTRYFGGTKLGTGGLIRAYGDAANEALDAARVEEHVVRVPVVVSFDYADTSPAMHTVGLFDAEIEDMQYSDMTTLRLAVRRSEVEAFSEAFVNALSGRGNVEALV